VNALALQGVTKRYGSLNALDGLDLAVPAGVICGLIGPNGAGKTTTYGVVGGLVRPDAGSVDVLGSGPLRPGGRVTLLPQDCELNPHTPVRELLIHYARLQGLSHGQARREADRVLDLVALSDRAKARIKQLSHGMRRRVAVAQAFLGSPELILLDEPTAGLDPDLVVRMRELFTAARGTATLVISSHVLAELEAVCDHVVFMDAGKVTRAGTIDEVTGQGQVVRITCEAPVDVAGTWEGPVYVARTEPGQGVAELNATVLRQLLDAGAAVLEVQRGRSLEETWMEGRKG